jgi:hypothetical protein
MEKTTSDKLHHISAKKTHLQYCLYQMVKIKTRAAAMATYKKNSSTNNLTFSLL